MALVRMLVSWGPAAWPVRDRFSNTLFFNVSGPQVPGPDYQDLADDLRDIYAQQSWTNGQKIEVRAYDMADDKPREERAYSTVTSSGNPPLAPPQIALCLSFYADRNLPRRRGRIYTGLWSQGLYAPAATMASLIALGQAFAGLGGLDVDWSVYSPTTDIGGKGETGHWRVSNIWVDNSWDVIRSRKLAATTRQTATING